MATNYSQGVIWPPVPQDLLDTQTKLRLTACGIEWEETVLGFYLFAEDGPYNGQVIADGSQEETEVDYVELLRELIIRSEGRLKALTIEGADGCTKMRPDGFGGFGFILTRDETYYVGTYEWVREKAEELGLTDDIYHRGLKTPKPTTGTSDGGDHVDHLG